ncbi:MAG: helix-turn-helix domain-containing protein [Lachnospiraceae bacterium]|nr:helix-turn-helix domain-containing protein [Lachnospiraceae bacterium]
MKNIDYNYLCTVIGNLSGIPIRVYEDKQQVFYHSLTYLPTDPAKLYLDDIFNIQTSIGYYVTKQFHYYGIINSGHLKIVMGPSGQATHTKQELRELAFESNVNADDIDDFVRGMQGIVPMPPESMMQMLCAINYFFNNEKYSLEDITIYDQEQKELENSINQHRVTKSFEDILPEQIAFIHNTYDLEQHLMDMVQRGDSKSLGQWLSHAPAIRSGQLAPDQLRQKKNTFIVSATLASRAAIRGGMAVDDAFSLSDAYIQKCEVLNSLDRITNLQYHMVQDFTDQVERLQTKSHLSPLVMEVSHYIKHHMSEPITADAIAEELFLSRPYLSRKFKQETGESLTDFILKEKVEEAKRLLRYSDKSLSAVSIYLGFSSQSHFTKVFKKYVSMSPGEYRKKNTIL